ncbi:hypothetical protein [Candidatus Poriferisodalis sp.]|uniref:hypothetical protein n=1 Tax=Candidatus Poriferisodalis sp. TaxID=3101277 RepID=UPI003B023B2A
MSSSSQARDTEHPLLRDRARLDNVLDVMYAAIQKVFFKNRRPVPRNSASERVIIGGASADDVLQEATLALLTHPDAEAVEDWCALGTVVAKNKAMDALDAARKHLSPTDHRVELYVVSGDAESPSPDGAVTTSVLQTFPDRNLNPEEEVLAIQSALSLRDLAREILGGREKKIFLEIKFLQRSRKQLGDELGLTPQRVGQLYEEASRRLEAHPRYPYRITE